MEKFALGVLLGGLGGALLASNNYKMRTLVRKGQQEAQLKFDQMLDEKIRMMNKTVEETEEAMEEKTEKKKKAK
jgi:hypothetical protein